MPWPAPSAAGPPPATCPASADSRPAEVVASVPPRTPRSLSCRPSGVPPARRRRCPRAAPSRPSGPAAHDRRLSRGCMEDVPETTVTPDRSRRALLLEGIHPDAEAVLSAAGFEVATEKGAFDIAELADRLPGVELLGIR